MRLRTSPGCPLHAVAGSVQQAACNRQHATGSVQPAVLAMLASLAKIRVGGRAQVHRSYKSAVLGGDINGVL